MEENQRYTARMQVVEAMEQGFSWHEAAKGAGLQISQSTAYRLRQRMRQGGELALREGRHGHPIKLRGVKCGNFWNRPVSKLLIRQATRSKRNSPSVLVYK